MTNASTVCSTIHSFSRPRGTAVMAGLPLPEVAWESVVLPAVVAFSTKAGLKLHLELAARFWVKTDASLIDAQGRGSGCRPDRGRARGGT
jgi:hypothetical protein